MNFQLSVIIWTVICFLILMAILKNLLFEPVLKVLDGRKEKLEAARAKRAETEKKRSAFCYIIRETFIPINF